MSAYSLSRELKVFGFETKDSGGWSETLRHPSGLVVSIDEHRWSIEHEADDWTEEGILDDTAVLFVIIQGQGVVRG